MLKHEKQEIILDCLKGTNLNARALRRRAGFLLEAGEAEWKDRREAQEGCEAGRCQGAPKGGGQAGLREAPPDSKEVAGTPALQPPGTESWQQRECSGEQVLPESLAKKRSPADPADTVTSAS